MEISGGWMFNMIWMVSKNFLVTDNFFFWSDWWNIDPINAKHRGGQNKLGYFYVQKKMTLKN